MVSGMDWEYGCSDVSMVCDVSAAFPILRGACHEWENHSGRPASGAT